MERNRFPFTCWASMLLLAGGFFAASAQERPPTLGDYLPQGMAYDAAVPTPQSFLGFEVGEWHVRHDQL
ncbi:MAG: hypothetical protein KDD47_24990, partial [Acidobacteria bacterium]|nr:hypothetical protein [Acidobacteriota bacterium]